MELGKSIRIYLKEGSPTGIKFVEVVNLTIQAISCPRNKLSDLNKYFQEESNRPGVYFLLGADDATSKVKVYIGESESVWDRLKSHDIQKDFWNEVILFTSKDDNLTKSHVKYLESQLITLSLIADRYEVINSTSPSINLLPLPDRDSMEEIVLNVNLITGTLGHKFLEKTISVTIPQKVNIPFTAFTESSTVIDSTGNLNLELNSKGLKAKAIQTNEGIVVLEGSEVCLNDSDSYSYKALRERLISEQILKPNENGKFTFVKNYLFKSPSSAAAVIVGSSVNGRNVWKDEKGRSLNEIEKIEVE